MKTLQNFAGLTTGYWLLACLFFRFLHLSFSIVVWRKEVLSNVDLWQKKFAVKTI